MDPRSTRIVRCVIAVFWIASVSLACDRGIEPFDPDELAAQPNLDRIYPKGAPEPARPGSAGMPNPAAPTRRGDPAPIVEPGLSVSGETITGHVELADLLDAGRASNATLFVIARRQGVSGGPPLAVLRIANPGFPLAFEIGQAQVMIPSMRFEGEVALSARLDSDGNAMTKGPGDLAGEISNPLLPGSRGVNLILDRKL